MAVGSGKVQGELWGARAKTWARQEEREIARYEILAAELDLGPGVRVLDVGCGSGVFCRVAASRGASVHGLDASEPLIELARARVPEAELQVGDLQFLPYADRSFDVVTGFNSFQFAADNAEALREARRVVTDGGRVLVQVWGRPEHCDLSAMLGAVFPLLPRDPSLAPGPLASSEPYAVETILVAAGLTPSSSGEIVTALEYADEQAMTSAMLSAGLVGLAARTSGEATVREAIVRALEPFRTIVGGYRFQNEWRYVIAAR